MPQQNNNHVVPVCRSAQLIWLTTAEFVFLSDWKTNTLPPKNIMVKIIEKIKEYGEKKPHTPYFSFEYFPPKTEAGVENLYLRMERMASLQPVFVDVTWVKD